MESFGPLCRLGCGDCDDDDDCEDDLVCGEDNCRGMQQNYSGGQETSDQVISNYSHVPVHPKSHQQDLRMKYFLFHSHWFNAYDESDDCCTLPEYWSERDLQCVCFSSTLHTECNGKCERHY